MIAPQSTPRTVCCGFRSKLIVVSADFDTLLSAGAALQLGIAAADGLITIPCIFHGAACGN
jgi:hypothetical protein